ncbi:MAG: hypothetical protein OSA97_05730 [Nevskia sp.]|nr:hypothetical protein [Nevskia sp.]
MPRSTIWTPPEDVPRPLYFVKTAYGFDEAMPLLNEDRLKHNKLALRETSIVFDTNVLIEIEQVVNEGNTAQTVQEHGLQPLVDLLRSPFASDTSFSVGGALREVPPSRVPDLKDAYERFVRTHLPRFADHPLAMQATLYQPELRQTFAKLPKDAQVFFAVSYTSLLCLLKVLKSSEEKRPLEVFGAYLKSVILTLDLISLKEANIARWCISPELNRDAGYMERRRRIRRNFCLLKSKRAPRNSDEAKAIAFNGACDLTLIDSTIVMDGRGFAGSKQDCWIATFDEKLWEFCSAFHHVLTEQGTGAFGEIDTAPSAEPNEFWAASALLLERIVAIRQNLLQRRGGRQDEEEFSEKVLLKAVESAEQAIERYYSKPVPAAAPGTT